MRRIPAIESLGRLAQAHDGEAWLVGGVLRDRALGRPGTPTDFDVAVSGSAEDFARRAARAFKGTKVVLDAQSRVYRVAAGPLQVDVAAIQGGSIQADLARRDFTINATAAALPWAGDDAILDPFGGAKDAKRRLLRVTGPKVIAEDPLRMLRAFRLAATLQLTIHPDTSAAVKTHRRKIAKAAGERVRAELMGVLGVKDATRWLGAMDAVGLLTEIFPELEASRRCAEVYYGKGGVLKHSLAVCERADRLLADPEGIYPAWGKAFEGGLAAGLGKRTDPKAIVRLACLLHDVAKPACAKTVAGRLRFFGHDARGAAMSVAILKRLRFSADEIETVRLAVHHHLRPGNLAANRIVSDKAVYRFFRDLGEHGIRLLAVCWADHASYLSPAALRGILPRIHEAPGAPSTKAPPRSQEARKTLFHLQVVTYLLRQWFERPETARPKGLLDGNAVMKALGVKPGPAVGKALAALAEAQAEGKVKNRSEALRFLKSRKQ